MKFIKKAKRIPARFGLSFLGLLALVITSPLTLTAPFFVFQAFPPSALGTFFLCGIFFIYYTAFSSVLIFTFVGTLLGLINKIFKKTIVIYYILIFSAIIGLVFGGLMSLAMFQITTSPKL